MAEVIKMPKMSDTMTEGVIVEWHKKEGDQVKSGDILAEVETDKATMELENYVKGTLLHIGVQKGEAVPVDAIIAVVGEPGEDISALLAGGSAPKKETSGEKKSDEPKTEAKEPQKEESKPDDSVKESDKEIKQTPQQDNGERLKASPLAKKMAEEKGINIKEVHGTGENGRIIRKDIEEYTPAKVAASASSNNVSAGDTYDEIPVTQMRKTIARRLSESKFSAPHFYLTMEINMDKAISSRVAMNEISDVKLSMNDIIVKASAMALRKNPDVNSSWMGDKIRRNHQINIGVAMALPEGLVVPVIRNSDNKSISEISKEVKAYSEKAKNKKLQPEDFSGNTFTISNLGMFGIDEFTAIINTPDACILAVGVAKETVIVVNGEMKIANMMKVTLSCDHRVVDGAVGSKFLQTLKQLLENPLSMLV